MKTPRDGAKLPYKEWCAFTADMRALRKQRSLLDAAAIVQAAGGAQPAFARAPYDAFAERICQLATELDPPSPRAAE